MRIFILTIILAINIASVSNGQTNKGMILEEDQSIGLNEFMQDNFGGTKLSLESDGNLNLYVDGAVKWSSNTGGRGVQTLKFQKDGNLVLYKSGGSAVWSSTTNGVFGTNADKLGGKSLVINGSGDVSIFHKARPNDFPGTKVWTLKQNGQYADSGSAGFKTGETCAFQAGPSYNYTKDVLGSPNSNLNLKEFTKGMIMQGCASSNGTGGSLVFEDNGNLVLYFNKGSNFEEVLWQSNTAGKNGDVLRMQNDGNLVMYKNNGTESHDAVWSTGTNGQGQTNCKMKMYQSNSSDKSTIFVQVYTYGNNGESKLWSMLGN